MRVFQVRWEIPATAAEPAADTLLELEQPAWSVLEDVIARRAWLVGLFPGYREAELAVAGLTPSLPAVPFGAPEIRELPETEWRDSYKHHFHAWRFGRLHWVPLWERDVYVVPTGDAVLWLDPGLAFGTGNHETTRLCVERLVEQAANPGTRGLIVDAGCGSGILALSAVKLGFSNVLAFDNDPAAVRVSRENADLNGLVGTARFCVADVASGLAGVQARFVMANILANVLIANSRDLVRSVAAGGSLVLSGILTDEIAEVRRIFSATAPGWPQDSRAMGGWSDLLLRRP